MSTIQELDLQVNVLRALLWQYNNAPNIQALLNDKQAWLDINQTGFWEDWITDIFDLRTANDFGLQVWAIILNQSLYTNFSPTPSGEEKWGFGTLRFNFNNGNFGAPLGGNRIYSTEVARMLLRIRYFQLTSAGTVPEINRMLKYLFTDYGEAYLVDNLDMTQTYTFGFILTSEMRYMLNNTDVLPRPAGVKSSIIEI